MLAMLDAVEKPAGGAIQRLGRRLKGERGVLYRHISILGAPVVHITLEIEQNIKPRTLEKQLSHVLRVLSGEGASGLCFERGFLYSEFFLQNGFTVQDTTQLYEVMADNAVRILPGEGGTAFFTAPRLNDINFRTLTTLCETRRYVLADVTAGGEAQFRDLQRRLGISIIDRPLPERIFEAQSAVFMGTRRVSTLLSHDCAVYAVNDSAVSGVNSCRRAEELDVELPSELETELPAGFSKEPFIAQALIAMSLAPTDLTLRKLNFSSINR